MLKPVRRIIAAHNQNGESYIQDVGDAPNITNTGGIEGFSWTELWAVDNAPASNAGNDDAADREIRLQPPENGDEAYAAGSGSRHPGFHKTKTVDYAIVLEGEVVAMMDVGETPMGPGDVLIQRGTNHAWSNRTDKACRIAFVLIDAENLT